MVNLKHRYFHKFQIYHNNLYFRLFFFKKTSYFRQLVRGQKVVMWFSVRQEFYFLSCPLSSLFHMLETVLQFKHCTTEVVIS